MLKTVYCIAILEQLREQFYGHYMKTTRVLQTDIFDIAIARIYHIYNIILKKNFLGVIYF